MRFILSIILMYGVFSTVFYETKIVGGVGREFGKANIALFGYLAYINLLLFAHFTYRISVKKLNFDAYIGWFLLFLSLLIAQPLVVDFQNAGVISLQLYKSLLSIGGKIGYFIVWIFSFFLSLALLIESEPFAREIWEDIKQSFLTNEKIIRKKGIFGAIFENFSINPFSSSSISFDEDILSSRKRPPKSPKAKTKLEREREKLRELQRRMGLHIHKEQI